MPTKPNPYLAAFQAADASGLGVIEAAALPMALSNLNEPLMIPMGELEEALDKEGTGLVKVEDWLAYFETQKDITVDDAIGEIKAEGSEAMLTMTGSELLQATDRMSKEARILHAADIHTAAWNSDINLVRRYIEIDRSSANAVDDTEFGGGYRPLHYASYVGSVEVVALLLEDGTVDINARTDSGCTSLFLACQQGRLQVAEMLIKEGADPTFMEEELNYTAVDVARPFREVFNLFKSEDYQYEDWSKKPPALSPCTLENARGNSIELTLPSIHEEPGVLKVREFKVKVVSLPTGTIADLLVVPRMEFNGGEEETLVLRGLEPSTSYGAYVAGINGFGYGEYGEMSNVVRTKDKPKKEKKVEATIEGSDAAEAGAGGDNATPKVAKKQALSPVDATPLSANKVSTKGLSTKPKKEKKERKEGGKKKRSSPPQASSTLPSLSSPNQGIAIPHSSTSPAPLRDISNPVERSSKKRGEDSDESSELNFDDLPRDSAVNIE